MSSAELVFIPSPGMGHLVAAVEIAKLLINRDQRLSVTFLIIKLPFDKAVISYIDSLSAANSSSSNSNPRMRFVSLPEEHHHSTSESSSVLMFHLIERQKKNVRKLVAEMIENSLSKQTWLAGLVLDMFCINMNDVANEFGVPTYVFFTSSACFLGLLFHIQVLNDDHNQNITEYSPNSDIYLPTVPTFSKPVPAKVLPSAVLEKEGRLPFVLSIARQFRKTKGLIINTFVELETYAVKALSDGETPAIYPIGPIINLEGAEKEAIIMSWLEDQPSSSVVFLCFGSMGSFYEAQIKEIAFALERCEQRFLWSLRRTSKENMTFPEEYSNPEEVLPEGFLERTAGRGKVIGWAPQVAVLSHKAVGGFVSHCGWNSVLESLWFGVPIATWPMYAEQQINAFELVVELGMAVEIKLDYRKDFNDPIPPLVTAEEIEKGIKLLMMNESENEVRRKVKEMKEKSRKAMVEGGSSYNFLGQLIEDILQNDIIR